MTIKYLRYLGNLFKRSFYDNYFVINLTYVNVDNPADKIVCSFERYKRYDVYYNGKMIFKDQKLNEQVPSRLYFDNKKFKYEYIEVEN